MVELPGFGISTRVNAGRWFRDDGVHGGMVGELYVRCWHNLLNITINIKALTRSGRVRVQGVLYLSHQTQAVLTIQHEHSMQPP